MRHKLVDKWTVANHESPHPNSTQSQYHHHISGPSTRRIQNSSHPRLKATSQWRKQLEFVQALQQVLRIDNTRLVDNAVLRKAGLCEESSPRRFLLVALADAYTLLASNIILYREYIAVRRMRVLTLHARRAGVVREKNWVSGFNRLYILADSAYNPGSCKALDTHIIQP